jgi:hypothetical protein
VNRALRSGLWAPLKAQGFATRTDRIAWRYVGGSVDLIEVSSVGPYADEVGCTSYSFSATVATLPPYLTSESVPVAADGRLRPRYWHCKLQKRLAKSLSQPWFRPFSTPVNPRLRPSMLKHREGLMRLLRRDTHDRAETWFVREDGSNLDENIADLSATVQGDGLPLLQTLLDPCAVVRIVSVGELSIIPTSPAGRDLIAAAAQACGGLMIHSAAVRSDISQR